MAVLSDEFESTNIKGRRIRRKDEIDGACVSTFVKFIVRLEVEILSFISVTVAITLSLLAPKL